MDHKKFLTHLALFVFFILSLNTLAFLFHWYFSVWYFDMFMHFLGGMWTGFLSIYLISRFKKESFRFPHDFKSVALLLFVVFAVGAGWEAFEFIVDLLTARQPFNFFDGISDIFFDLAGGLFAVFYFLKRIIFIKKDAV